MYIYVSSEDCQDLFVNNDSSHFTIQLPKPLEAGQWDIALVQVFYKTSTTPLYLLCDACDGSVLKGREFPVLSCFSEPGLLPTSVYVPITTEEVNRISFKVLDNNLKPWQSSETIYLTLHLRKR